MSSVLWKSRLVDGLNSDTISTQLNSLDEPTTIHLHGMFLAGINHFDGAARVTQWCVPRCVALGGAPFRLYSLRTLWGCVQWNPSWSDVYL